MNSQLPVEAAYHGYQPVNRQLADALHLSQTCFSGRRKVKVYILSGLPFVLAGLLALLTLLVIPPLGAAGLGAIAAGYFALGSFSSVVVYKKLSRRKVAFLDDLRRYLLTPEYLPCMTKLVPLRRSVRTSSPLPATMPAPAALPNESATPVVPAQADNPPANIRKTPSPSQVPGDCSLARPLSFRALVAQPARTLPASTNGLSVPVAADLKRSARIRSASLSMAPRLVANSNSQISAGLPVRSIKPVFSPAITNLLPPRPKASPAVKPAGHCSEITADIPHSIRIEPAEARWQPPSTPLRVDGHEGINKRQFLSLIGLKPVPVSTARAVPTLAPVSTALVRPTPMPVSTARAVPTLAPVSAALVRPTPIPVSIARTVPTLAPVSTALVRPTPIPVSIARTVPTLAPASTVLAKSAPAPVSTALAVPASCSVMQTTGSSSAGRCLLVNVAFERRGSDIHLLFGRQALRSGSSQMLKIEQLATPLALTDGSDSVHRLQLSLPGERGVLAFTVTVGSGQLATLFDQFKSGTGRLVIDSKSLPALAGNQYPSLCAGDQTHIAGATIRPLPVANPEVSKAVAIELPFRPSLHSEHPPAQRTVRATRPQNIALSTNPQLTTHNSQSITHNPQPTTQRHSSRTTSRLQPLHLPAPGDSVTHSSSNESTPSTSPTSEGSAQTWVPAGGDNSNSVEPIPQHMPLPPGSPPSGDSQSLPLMTGTAKSSTAQRDYTGFKRFASESDIYGLSHNPFVDRSLLITSRLPDAPASLDDSVRLGSLRLMPSLTSSMPDQESDAGWEFLEPFEQHLKQENRDLELHEHLVHQLAYNLEGKHCVTLPDDQRCIVEKITGVPAGLNAYVLVPETSPATGATEIRLLFRGTKDRASVIRDLESSGAGFETMETAAATIIGQLQVILASLNDCSRGINLTIGGHSLGGADAQNFLGHLLGAMVAEASEVGSGSHLVAIHHITLFTKCSAGVPELAHERVCSALQHLQGIKVKIFHLKVAGDVVQATGDCHIGAGLPSGTADVSVLQVYPAHEASRIDRHTKKYFTDDANLAPVYWYKWTQNKSDVGVAEISRSLHNTSAVLRYNAVKTMQWALHLAAWFCTPTGASSGKKAQPTLVVPQATPVVHQEAPVVPQAMPVVHQEAQVVPQATPVVPVAAVNSPFEMSSEQEIKEVYDRIIALCLRLTNRPIGTQWDEVKPYESSAGKSATGFKPSYLKSMLSESAFDAGAEFQILVNQINTQALNIKDSRVIRGLLVKIGIDGALGNEPEALFKGLSVKDALWLVSAHYCENFFAAAARQYTAVPSRWGRGKTGPRYTFELLLQLQAFNIRYSTLERGVNEVNFSTGTGSAQRKKTLLYLQQRADSLQQEVGALYKQCENHHLSDRQIAFILGQPVPCEGILTSKKVGNFKRSIDKALIRITSG